MRPTSAVCRAIAVLFLVAAPLHLAASTAEFRVYFDSDNNPATGCNLTVGSQVIAGVEQVLNTSVEVTSTGSNVTGVTRQECNAAAFGSPITVSATGWPVGTAGSSGNSNIETRIPLSAFAG